MREKVVLDDEQFLKLIRALNKLNDTLDKLRETLVKVEGIHVHYKIKSEKAKTCDLKTRTCNPDTGDAPCWTIPIVTGDWVGEDNE